MFREVVIHLHIVKMNGLQLFFRTSLKCLITRLTHLDVADIHHLCLELHHHLLSTGQLRAEPVVLIAQLLVAPLHLLLVLLDVGASHHPFLQVSHLLTHEIQVKVLALQLLLQGLDLMIGGSVFIYFIYYLLNIIKYNNNAI